MSTDTLSNQVPINGTISYIVAPGSKTNYYYIPISNLPFQTSWQQLKDHVRTVCSSVERVEIFRGSTSGWVCVKGRENFDAAIELFETRMFNGRCIFSDARNATFPTLIKDVEGSPHQLRGLTQYPPSSSTMMSPTSAEFTKWIPTTSPTGALSPIGEYPSQVPPYNYGEMYNEWSTEAATGYYTDQPHFSPVATEHPYNASYQYQAGQNYNTGYPYPDNALGESYGAGAGAVQTIKCKIIIRQLPSWAGENQVQELLQHKSNIHGDKILQIDLPLSANDNKTNRGFATVTLDTEETASRAIRKLHGHKYGSRILSVEHTKEGMSANEGHRSRTTKIHRDAREKGDKKEGHSRHSSSADKKGSKSYPKSDVIIADGSSLGLRKLDKDKRPSPKS